MYALLQQVLRLQVENLTVVTSIIKISDVNILEFHQRLIDMLTIVVPELYLHLRSNLWVVYNKHFEIFLPDGQAIHRLRYLIVKQEAFLVAYFKSTNLGTHSKALPEEQLIVYLIANFVGAFLYK